MNLTVALMVTLAGLLVFFGGGTYVHHRGYLAGQAEREAYYARMVRDATVAKQRADQRATQAERAAASITQSMESEHAQTEQRLATRASAAESRLADLLRQRAAACAATDHQSMPQTPGPAPGAMDGSASDARVRRLAASLADIGARCESDAARLSEWQEWYRRQQSAAVR